MTGRGDGAPPPEALAELRSADGAHIVHRRWIPERPRATLVVAHGLGEHSGRYASLAAALNRRGVAVFAGDFRGHGRSAGRRGHVGRFDELLGDLERVREEAVRALPGLPLLLLGHSMGGLVSIRLLETRPDLAWRGAVLSAPALALEHGGARPTRLLARALSVLTPSLRLPNGIPAEYVSSDPAEVEALREDPLAHRWITPRLYAEMQRAMGDALRDRDRIRPPLLVLVPGQDRIVRAAAALEFCRSMPFEVRRYPDLRHEPLHEVGRAAVEETVADWVEARID